MKTITLYTVSPAGGEEEEYGRMEQFAEELNRFYKKFNNLQVELTAYGMKLPVKKDGKYAVKVIQTPVLSHVRKSVLCCVIFFCKKEEVAADEMNILIRTLMQQKKAEVMVYFKPNDDMQPVRNDIMRRIVQIDEKMGVPREDRKRLSDMAKNFVNLGCSFDRENRLKEAEGAYKEALVIQRKLTKADEETYLPDLALPYHNLGTLYFRTNRLKEAEPMYTEAFSIRKKLLEKKGEIYLPMVAASGINLGALYMRTDRLEEAEKIYKEVLEIRENLAERQPDNAAAQMQLADIYGNLGSLYSRMKRTEDGEKNFRQAFDITEKLLAEYRDNDTLPLKGKELKQKAAMLGNTLGVIYLNQNRRQEAEERYLLSCQLYEELAKEQPDEFEPPLSMVSFNLANIYRSMNQPDKAAPYMEKTWDICSKRKDSSSLCKQIYDSMNAAMKAAAEKQEQIAGMLKKQGKEHYDNGRYEDAVRSYQQAAELYKGMENAVHQSEAALLYNELGLLHWDIGQLEEAETSYLTALEIYRKIAENDDSHLSDVAIASYNLGRFYQETKDQDVNEYLREAFEIAGQCRDNNEQCRDIYENLEDEPLYGETETADHAEAPEMEENRTSSGNEDEMNEDRTGEDTTGKKTWWQKLLKK